MSKKVWDPRCPIIQWISEVIEPTAAMANYVDKRTPQDIGDDLYWCVLFDILLVRRQPELRLENYLLTNLVRNKSKLTDSGQNKQWHYNKTTNKA